MTIHQARIVKRGEKNHFSRFGDGYGAGIIEKKNKLIVPALGFAENLRRLRP